MEENEEERKKIEEEKKKEKQRKKQVLESLFKPFGNNRGIHILLACTVIYILLHRLFEKLISQTLVAHLFSQITSDRSTSIVALLLFLGFSYYAIDRALRYNYRRNPIRNFLALLLVCFIIYYRISDSVWTFTLIPNYNIYYINLILISIVTCLIWNCHKQRYDIRSQKDENLRTTLFLILFYFICCLWATCIPFLGNYFSYLICLLLIFIFLCYCRTYPIKKLAASLDYHKLIHLNLVVLYTTICCIWTIFVSFVRYNNLSFVDLLLEYEILVLVLAAIQFIEDAEQIQKSINNTLGFSTDTPIEKSEEDQFNRVNLAKQLAQKLLNTFTQKGAFAMGVCGEWGTGKTSFCNLILNTIENEKNQLGRKLEIVRFNPWLSKDKNSLIGSFFDQLSNQLKKYDSCLSHELLAYGKLLSGIFRQSPIDPKSVVQLLQPEQDLNEYFDSINQAIAKANLQLIIYVDDLDRLLYDEVPEVLKLIRNSANFNHTYFLVTYDKNYIVEALRSHQVHNPTVFIEKIFQYDFILPPLTTDMLAELFRENIVDMIEKSNRNFNYDQLREEVTEYANKIFINSNALFIATYRDIIRLTNNLLISYNLLKENIYLFDLILIEILKLKYYKFYLLFRDHLPDYLEINKIGMVILKSETDQTNEYAIEKKLEDKSFIDDTENQKKNFLELLKLLFGNKDNSKLQQFSIQNALYTDYYFMNQLDYNTLFEKDFINLRLKNSFEEIKREIGSDFYTDKKKLYLKQRICDIQLLLDKIDYENMMCLALYLNSEKNRYDEHYKYLKEKLLNFIIDHLRFTDNTATIFDSDINAYRQFWEVLKNKDIVSPSFAIKISDEINQYMCNK